MPQNRERVFIVGIRNDIDYHYTFPTGKQCNTTLNDVLENKVDDKFYITDARLKGLLSHGDRHKEKGSGFNFKPKNKNEIANCLLAGIAGIAGKSNTDTFIIDKTDTCKVAGILTSDKYDKMHDISRRVHSTTGLSPTIHTMGGGNNEPKIIEAGNVKTTDGHRIRKLTPLECWRLQGFTDDEFNRAKDQGLSNSQLYKQAGNSITVNVLASIIKNLKPALGIK